MSFRLGDLPPELVETIAHHLDDSSCANLFQACKDMNALLIPELRQRAKAIALAPRHMYEEQFVYGTDQKEGIDTPLFVLERPLLQPQFGLVEGEALAEAVVRDQVDAARFFLKAGVNPNAYIISGTRMLSLAVRYMNVFMVRLFLEFGADPLLRDLIDDMSPMRHAVETCRDDIVEVMINAGGDLAEFDVLGAIVRRCGRHILELCINHGANLAAVGKSNQTILHYLVGRNDLDIFNLMIPHFPASMLNEVNLKGQTALHLALIHTRPRLIEALLALSPLLDINARDSVGCTPLHYALSQRHISAVYDLLARGARVNIVTWHGENELHLAVKTQHVDLVRLFLRYDLDIDAHNRTTPTPIHCAIQLGDEAIVRALLTEGRRRPDLEIKNAEDRTPFHEALCLGAGRIVSLLD